MAEKNSRFNKTESNDTLWKKSEELQLKSLEIRKQIGDKKGISNSLNSLGDLYFSLNQYPKAIKYSLEAYKIETEINVPQRILSASKILHRAYSKTGDYKNAYYYYQRYQNISDSVLNEKNRKDLLAKTLSYEYEKKSLADSLRNAEQRHLDQMMFESKEEKQKLFTLSALLVGGLLLILLAITYRNFRKNKSINIQLTNQNRIITEQNSEMERKNAAIQLQKEIIEEKNREIVDSIQYAKRIQDAILPNSDNLQDKFSDSFILFKPKDIVSGDFYWIENKSNYCYVSVVDCTGHGVPGAFISLIGLICLIKLLTN